MAHGFSATRRDGLEPYAERFADAGFGVLLFDYRGFGESGGEPRQVIDIRGQQEDYRAAIRAAARVPWVDASRIALFGSSFSGGHVVTVASGDAQIAAVIAQAPFADGIAQLRITPPLTSARMTFDALRDAAGAALGRPPVTIPAAGAPGTYAVMTAAGGRARLQRDRRRGLALAQRGRGARDAAHRPVATGQGRDPRRVPAARLRLRRRSDHAAGARRPDGAERAARRDRRGTRSGTSTSTSARRSSARLEDQVAFLQRVLAPREAAVAA